MYLGLRIANLLFAKAWRFHLAQRLGRIGARLVTGKDGMDSLAALHRRQVDPNPRPPRPPQSTFHEWWAARAKEAK